MESLFWNVYLILVISPDLYNHFFYLDKPQHHTDFTLKHHNFNVMEFRYDSSGLLNHPDLAQASFFSQKQIHPSWNN